jgi:hypothetical protein
MSHDDTDDRNKSVKCGGKRNSWFADAEGYGSIGMIHERWFDEKTLTYCDPDQAWPVANSAEKTYERFRRAILDGGYVVLCSNDWGPATVKSPHGVPSHKKFLSIWRVDVRTVHRSRRGLEIVLIERVRWAY